MPGEKEYSLPAPNPKRAKRLASKALELARRRRFDEAVRMIEQAIRWDQINGLNRYCLIRAKLYNRLENSNPALAIEWYKIAVRLAKQHRYRDAKVAYQECFALDRAFLWPFNNYAWMLATCREPSIRDGSEALIHAAIACEKSKWSCWAFVGTLAAAHAECGDFKQAVDWQNVSLGLAPADHKIDSLIQLRHYQAGRAYIDEGLPKAAGG